MWRWSLSKLLIRNISRSSMENQSLDFRVYVEMVRFVDRVRVRTDAVEAQFCQVYVEVIMTLVTVKIAGV